MSSEIFLTSRRPSWKQVFSMRMRRAMLLVIGFMPWASPCFGETIFGIDAFTTFQTVVVTVGSATNSVATAGAIGGYRTLAYTSNGNPEETSSLTVSAATSRLNMSTPVAATGSFEVTWGGANGTAGLGGIDITSGWPDLAGSSLQFRQRSADFASNLTWTFIDTANKTSSYAFVLPARNPVTDPTPAQFSIPLSSFTSQSGFNWTSINFIKLSGGNVPEMDLSLTAPMQIATVPEPSAYALAAVGIAAAFVMARRKGA